MKSRKAVMASVIGLTLITSGAGIALASPDRCERGEGHAYHDDYRKGPGAARLEHMTEYLDLSREQREQIAAIMQEQRAATAAKRDALSEARTALHDAARADNYDATKIEALAAQQAGLQKELIVMRMEGMHRVNQVLTPEQRAEMERMREKRREYREDYRERDDD